MSRRRLLPLIGCLFLALAPSAGAQRLLDWRGGSAPERLAPAQGADATASWLRLERTGAGYQAWVRNPLSGPAQVRLRMRSDAAGYRSVPALPLQIVLKAGERRLLAQVYRLSQDSLGPLDLWLDAVPGDPAALPDGHLYRLPFTTAPVRIDQGFEGEFSHRDAANRYALDFALPEGTAVLAAREGIVLQAEGDSREAGADRERYGGRANLVRILHRDGSMAIYAHLAPGSLAVRPGQAVRAGDVLAGSGQSGFSTAPHLHFAVQVNAGLALAAIPFRMAGPLGELRFAHRAADGPAAEPSVPPPAPTDTGPL